MASVDYNVKEFIAFSGTNSKSFTRKNFPLYEFHIAKLIRSKYEINESLFSTSGNIIFANFAEARKLTSRINKYRKQEDYVKGSQLNASGLLDEIYHFLLREYELNVNPEVFKRAVSYIKKEVGELQLYWLLTEFVELFPPKVVFSGKQTTAEYLKGSTENRLNAEITLEELLLLNIANFNPANKKLIELFDENYFSNKETYSKIIATMEKFFKQEKTFGPDNLDIFTLLKEPILKNPESLELQLEYIESKFKILLKDKFSDKILKSKDFIKEEIMLDFTDGGGAPVVAPNFRGLVAGAENLRLGKSGYKYAVEAYKEYDEPENFTEDIGWMPQVILLAKNTYVWLDQLSKKYSRHIYRLDQVPDEELDLISSRNFNALWLIGVWERSDASRKIKYKMGNLDAVSSAYSLDDYKIAQKLGGNQAYENLNQRAKARGIRLASDMVPNHTGISSKWINEHPEYFIQCSEPPFPSYSFNGEDLSDNPDIEIKIEDRYYNHSDAAVVFKRYDKRNGDIRYIYHGNDGTMMPWNDTAQLDMLKAEVREAVIQKIFNVAEKFSIIRFDAAMTLAKKHFQRLWYPHPGTGGDIPSRSDYGMTRSEFDNFFPVEFWREVVDRINQTMPETLLLAEAFWLMEGYFVRTLGMHRVYNSAFMHMLMKEENEKFKKLITNTLEFEPEILKRYVNFMSNPDEETAIKQFGSEDKYFGVCILMITLPGLPMFAHGQIEGYTEKYGMEYQRAYYNEQPNSYLVERHNREIFPLMEKRYLFSQVENFWYYDFYDSHGFLNNNVFAYTNMSGNQRALVFYNNKYDRTEGRIFYSSEKLNYKKEVQKKSLFDALNFKYDEKIYYIFKEHITELEYIRHSVQIAHEGFYAKLNGFQYSVFHNFREVYDENGTYKELYDELGGNGTHSINELLYQRSFKKIHRAFEILFAEETSTQFCDSLIFMKENENSLKFVINKYSIFLHEIAERFNLSIELTNILHNFKEKLLAVKLLNEFLQTKFKKHIYKELHNSKKNIMLSEKSNYKNNALLYLLYLVVDDLQNIFATENPEEIKFLQELSLYEPIKKVLNRLGKGSNEVNYEIFLIKTLLNNDNSIYSAPENILNIKGFRKESISKDEGEKLLEAIEKNSVQALLGINKYKGVTYYSKESFEYLSDWFMSLKFLETARKDGDLSSSINYNLALNKLLKKISENSQYKLYKLIEFICSTE